MHVVVLVCLIGYTWKFTMHAIALSVYKWIDANASIFLYLDQ